MQIVDDGRLLLYPYLARQISPTHGKVVRLVVRSMRFLRLFI